MALNPEQVGDLLKMIQQTRDVELSCSECMDELDKYVQSVLDGAPITGVLERVREHLAECPWCEEEFNLVIEAIKGMEE